MVHSGVFIGSCDVIGMEFPKGKWVCYSRILVKITSLSSLLVLL